MRYGLQGFSFSSLNILLPDRTFHNCKASKSVDQRISYAVQINIDRWIFLCKTFGRDTAAVFPRRISPSSLEKEAAAASQWAKRREVEFDGLDCPAFECRELPGLQDIMGSSRPSVSQSVCLSVRLSVRHPLRE